MIILLSTNDRNNKLISLIVQLEHFSIIYGPVELTVPTWSTVRVTLLLIKIDVRPIARLDNIVLIILFMWSLNAMINVV